MKNRDHLAPLRVWLNVNNVGETLVALRKKKGAFACLKCFVVQSFFLQENCLFSRHIKPIVADEVGIDFILVFRFTA